MKKKISIIDKLSMQDINFGFINRYIENYVKEQCKNDKGYVFQHLKDIDIKLAHVNEDSIGNGSKWCYTFEVTGLCELGCMNYARKNPKEQKYYVQFSKDKDNNNTASCYQLIYYFKNGMPFDRIIDDLEKYLDIRYNEEDDMQSTNELVNEFCKTIKKAISEEYMLREIFTYFLSIYGTIEEIETIKNNMYFLISERKRNIINLMTPEDTISLSELMEIANYNVAYNKKNREELKKYENTNKEGTN